MTRHRTDRAPSAAPSTPRVEADARLRLGRNLRLLYAGILHQPLPERFTQLLDDLSANTTRAGTRDTEGSR